MIEKLRTIFAKVRLKLKLKLFKWSASLLAYLVISSI